MTGPDTVRRHPRTIHRTVTDGAIARRWDLDSAPVELNPVAAAVLHAAAAWIDRADLASAVVDGFGDPGSAAADRRAQVDATVDRLVALGLVETDA